MDLPDGYTDALSDELAPYGLEFSAVNHDGADTEIVFHADPDSFVQQFPYLGIAESYGSAWPPAALALRLHFDAGGDPVELDFETVDLMSQTASTDPALRDRLNTLADPADHAVAVGQALALAITPADAEKHYFE